MDFTFSQVSGALEYAHRIDSARLLAFRARLKHYQKRGWPAGLNTGRGRAATYGPGHVVQLALALELNELGLSPERAMSVLDQNRRRWAIGVKNMAQCGIGATLYHQFLVIDPSGLDDLRAANDPGRSEHTLHYLGAETLKQAVAKWSRIHVTRFAVINITSAFEPIMADLARFMDERMFLKEIEAWADGILNGDT